MVTGEVPCTAEPVHPGSTSGHRVGTSLSSQRPSLLPGAHVGGAARGCA